MKTKLIIIILILFSQFACNTTKQTTTTGSIKTKTALVQSGQSEKSSAVSGSDVSENNLHVEKTESETEINIKLSPPDSAGNQYPTDITVKGKNATTLIDNNWKKSSNVCAAVSEKNVTDLQIDTKTDLKKTEKTLSKSGFSGLEKIGIGAVFLVCFAALVLIFKNKLKIFNFFTKILK